MKTRIMFPIVGIIVGLLASLCIPMSISAQQMSMRSMTKDIPLTHIDGGGKLTLDVSDDLGLTTGEALKLVNALPSTGTDGTGVTIEVLKPVDSTVHSKALVIRRIKPKLTEQLGDGGASGIKIKELRWIEEDRTVLPEGWNEFSVMEFRYTVLIELYNTTKSRLDLQNWQIRFTYGAMPDVADTTMHTVVDRMSNIDDRDWGHRDPQDLGFVLGSVSMFRHIDVERLNDPTKTLDEQLAAISDGTRQTGWDLRTALDLNEWIEIYNAMGENAELVDLGNLRWQMKIERHSKDENGNPRILHVPSPPTDDR